MLRMQLILVGLMTLGLASCSNEEQAAPTPEVPEAGSGLEEETPEAETPVPEGQSEETEDPATSEVSLEVKSWEEIQKVIADSKGKVVVVDFWATYCGPCLVELPNLVKLHNEHSDQVKCISVSLDYQGFEDQPVESYQEPVLAALKQRDATLQNILCSTDADTMFNEKLKLPSIPILFIYNQAGELVSKLPDTEKAEEFTYQADVIPVVMNLLKSN